METRRELKMRNRKLEKENEDLKNMIGGNYAEVSTSFIADCLESDVVFAMAFHSPINNLSAIDTKQARAISLAFAYVLTCGRFKGMGIVEFGDAIRNYAMNTDSPLTVKGFCDAIEKDNKNKK